MNDKVPEKLSKIEYAMGPAEAEYNTVVDEYNSPNTTVDKKIKLLEKVRILNIENLFD